MTPGIRIPAPDAIQLVHGEYLPLGTGSAGVDLDVWGDLTAPFEFDIDAAPRETVLPFAH